MAGANIDERGDAILPTTKCWDVFISHASEDKDAVALPLAKALEGASVKVWLDQEQLRIGDSLRASIDEGLSKSRFGVVIISGAFLGKQWPARELNALMALEEDGHKVILPVWHGVTKSKIAEHSPILADRLAAETIRGVAYVAGTIKDVVFDPKNGSPSAEMPSLGRRFIELLEATRLSQQSGHSWLLIKQYSSRLMPCLMRTFGWNLETSQKASIWA
jgi:hypothetical protein